MVRRSLDQLDQEVVNKVASYDANGRKMERSQCEKSEGE